MQNYQFILFDADGVLFDFHKAEITALDNTFLHLGLQVNDEYRSIYKEVNTKIWHEFERNKITASELRIERFRRFLEIMELDFSAKKMSELYINELKKMSHLLPDAYSVVKKCSEIAELAIITNGLSDVQRERIGNSPLKKFFKNIFISEEIGYPKPDKRIFNYVFSQVHYNIQDTIIIGDNLKSDIKGGNDFGIDTCWFNQFDSPNETNISPTYQISKLSEFIKIIFTKNDNK